MTLLRTCAVAISCVGFLFSSPAKAQAETEAAVPFVQTAPTGWDFNGKEWHDALKIDSFFKPGAFRLMGKSFSTNSEIKTELYLLRTEDALYLGVICYDHDGVLRKGNLEQEERDILGGNRFEIYLDGDLRDRQAYYQMIVNPAGKLWLSKAGDVISAQKWTCDVESGEEAWKIRMRIPFSEIGIASDTTEPLHANFFRDYHPLADGEERQFSTWKGAAIGSFHSLKPLILLSPDEP